MTTTTASVVLLSAAVGLALAMPAHAQIGAFGGAPAALSSGDESTHFAMPIMGESAVFSPAGTLAGALMIGYTMGTLSLPGADIEYGVTQTAGSIHYAVSERAVIGASVRPWNQVSLTHSGSTVSESGLGDASVHGRYRLWQSADAQTALAVFGSVSLPLGEDGFGSEGVATGLGLAVSRQLEAASLHASAGALVPTDEVDGEAVVSVTAGGMYRVGARTSVGGDIVTRFSDGEYVSDLVPGIRFQFSPRVMLDAAVLVNMATSLPAVYDSGLVIAVRMAR